MTERLFVAVDPSPVARAAIEALQGRLSDALSPRESVRWVKPASMHLTLRFLGDVAADRVAPIGEALGPVGAEIAPFEIAFDTLGAFPDARRPRVLWIAPSHAGPVKALAARVDATLAGVGIEADPRPFAPHLTLARVKRAGAPVGPVLDAVSPETPLASAVTEVVLYRSELHPDGARYSVRKRVPLTG